MNGLFPMHHPLLMAFVPEVLSQMLGQFFRLLWKEIMSTSARMRQKKKSLLLGRLVIKQSW